MSYTYWSLENVLHWNPLTSYLYSLIVWPSQATIAEFDSKTEIEKEGSLSSVFYVVLFGSMSVYRRAGNKKRRYDREWAGTGALHAITLCLLFQFFQRLFESFCYNIFNLQIYINNRTWCNNWRAFASAFIHINLFPCFFLHWERGVCPKWQHSHFWDAKCSYLRWPKKAYWR